MDFGEEVFGGRRGEAEQGDSRQGQDHSGLAEESDRLLRLRVRQHARENRRAEGPPVAFAWRSGRVCGRLQRG